MSEKAARWIEAPWNSEGGLFSEQIFESDRPRFSKVLGPDGEPLQYPREKIGYDTSPRGYRQNDKA